MNLGAEVSGTIVDSGGKPLENISLYFTTNPTFGGKSDNKGKFSIVLPMTGNDGQGLFYSAYYFYQGERKVLALNQQYTSDKDLGQLRTIIPGKTSAGGGGGNNQPSDTTAPLVSSASVNGDTFILSLMKTWPTSVPLPADFMVKVNGRRRQIRLILAYRAAT